MTSPNSGRDEISVSIGEIRLTSPPNLLKATLGSCVGIAILWKDRKAFGLAHCLLPKELPSAIPESKFDRNSPAKYVDQAIPTLLKMMEIRKENYKELEVHVYGGANMLDQLAKLRPNNHLGIQNGEMALKTLADLGIFVNRSDLGGTQARQVWIDCSTEEAGFKTIGRLETE